MLDGNGAPIGCSVRKWCVSRGGRGGGRGLARAWAVSVLAMMHAGCGAVESAESLAMEVRGSSGTVELVLWAQTPAEREAEVRLERVEGGVAHPVGALLMEEGARMEPGRPGTVFVPTSSRGDRQVRLSWQTELDGIDV